jgi:glycosyltransferase involved in cell wall biosynthesis
MKRILFITGGSDSGSEHCLFTLMNSLDSEEVHVTVLARYNDYQLRHGIPCRLYFSEENFLTKRSLAHRSMERLLFHGEYFPFTRFFKHIVKVSKPDLIYCNNLTLPGYYDFFFQLGIPYIVHAHSLHHYYYSYPFPLLEKRLLQASLVISSSETQRKSIQYLLPGIDAEIIYPPVVMKELLNDEVSRQKIRHQWGIPPQSMVWAMASTYFNYNKDPDRFIELGYGILKKSPEVYLVWVGGSAGLTAMKMALNKLTSYGLEKHFIFTGDCGREEYIRYIDASDGLLLISLEESFSITAAEAITLGKPVLAFDCGGVREMIREENGCLVPPFSYEKMVDEAVRVEQNRYSYNRDKMIESVSKFDILHQSDSWKSLILNVHKNK